jgi:hypothetical protein
MCSGPECGKDSGQFDLGVGTTETSIDRAKDDSRKSDSCSPLCVNRVCGPDPICGISCGPCAAPKECNASGQCLKVPLVTTLAGSSEGYADGPAASAKFVLPIGVAVDATGRVLVLDYTDKRIRAIANGQVTTLAGNGKLGYADGPTLSAMFHDPLGVAVDSGGKVYISEDVKNTIRLIDNGQVSTFAGNGSGYSDGPAASAKFSGPEGLAVDNKGKLYIADTLNQRIRVIENGVVSTLAGNGTMGFADGPADSAMFSNPSAIAVDGQERVYVADFDNVRVRVIYRGQVSTLAGNGKSGYVDGPAVLARFESLGGIAVDFQGRVYVADSKNQVIRVIENGQVSTFAGNGSPGYVDGPGESAMFNWPYGIAIDLSGNVTVADSKNAKIRLIAP